MLRYQRWDPVGPEQMVASFLRSEIDKVLIRYLKDRSLADAPDFSNAFENALRLLLLHLIRGGLLAQLPRDTTWYRVTSLTPAHFDELRAINATDWLSPNDRNELRKVAARKQIPLEPGDPNVWEPILFAHDRTGPYTILEGNHRMTSYCGASDPPPATWTAYVGISRSPCHWHLPDQGK